MMNDYAVVKLAKNRPERRRSIYNNWYPVTVGEFYKVLAILISSGIDRKPSVRDYWSTSAHAFCF
jgi:hypothetical protein